MQIIIFIEKMKRNEFYFCVRIGGSENRNKTEQILIRVYFCVRSDFNQLPTLDSRVKL